MQGRATEENPTPVLRLQPLGWGISLLCLRSFRPTPCPAWAPPAITWMPYPIFIRLGSWCPTTTTTGTRAPGLQPPTPISCPQMEELRVANEGRQMWCGWGPPDCSQRPLD